MTSAMLSRRSARRRDRRDPPPAFDTMEPKDGRELGSERVGPAEERYLGSEPRAGMEGAAFQAVAQLGAPFLRNGQVVDQSQVSPAQQDAALLEQCTSGTPLGTPHELPAQERDLVPGGRGETGWRGAPAVAPPSVVGVARVGTPEIRRDAQPQE